MASPKFDRISVELSRRIGDPVASAGSAGKVLTAAERDAYVNKAMHKLIADTMKAVGGDSQKFIEIFPELYTQASITTTAGGTYDISASSIKHFYKIVDGFTNLGGVYIKALPKTLYTIVKLGINTMYAPSSTNLFVFEVASVLYFFPAASFNALSVTIGFIMQALHTDGSFFSNGDTVGDIPFYDHWTSAIAEIAEELVRIDRQFQS